MGGDDVRAGAGSPIDATPFPDFTLQVAGGRPQAVTRPLVMAILNATPDSFSDGGRLDEDLEGRVRAAMAEGADLLDVGGESTRPGHKPVPAEEELARVIPVIRTIRRVDTAIPVSIDTRKAVVAKAALQAGASFVNDVSGLGDPGMATVVRDAGCSLVLMRNQDLNGPLLPACRAELQELVRKATAAGIPRSHLILDPGLGFGSPPGGDVEANLALIDRVADYADGLPVLIGASRKRFIGTMTGVAKAEKRVAGSVAMAVRAVQAGAAIVRVHDVSPTVAALGRLRG